MDSSNLRLARVDSDISFRLSRGDGTSKRSSLSLHDLVTSPNTTKGTDTSTNDGLDGVGGTAASNESYSEEYKTELQHLLIDLHGRRSRQSTPTPYEQALQHYLENKYKDLKQHEQSQLYSPMPSPIYHHHHTHDSSVNLISRASCTPMSRARIDDLSRPSPHKVYQVSGWLSVVMMILIM